MTISAAFNNALSGLTATGRATGVISDNISNALTPGYGKRGLEIASNTSSGQGVRIVATTRYSDPVLIANRRTAEAGQSHARAISGFQTAWANLVGGPDDATSIVNQLSRFEATLVAAASNPASKTRLDTAVSGATSLATAIGDAADGLSDLRLRADREINRQVGEINQALADVEEMNTRIRSVTLSGQSPAALVDQRQLLIDGINAKIPVNVVPRSHGTVALYTEGGAIVLDGRAVEFDFTPTTSIAPHMTVENGLLSGLEISGQPVRTLGPTAAIRGGSLAAAFEVRDVLSVGAQADLDAMARDLAERFGPVGVDATVAPGDPGLFTDAGTLFDPSAEIGLSGRLQVNAVLDPQQGGDSWKLRAGLGAAAAGEPGDASLLHRLSDALTETRSVASGRFGTGEHSAASVSASLSSLAGAAKAQADQRQAFASAAYTETQRLELEQGVDTDAELQSLIRVEQAYAANARVIQVVGDLMDKLLRL